MTRKMKVAASAIGLLVAIVMAGCSSSESGETAASASPYVENATKRSADYASGGAEAPMHYASRQPGAERSVMRQARLGVDVDDLDKAEKDMKAEIASRGGYIDHLEGSGLAGEEPMLSLTIRIPEKSFEETLTKFEALGHRTDKAIWASDLTEQILDAEARLQQLKAEQPSNSGDFVGERIKQLQNEKASLVMKTTMSTIDLTLRQKPNAGKSGAANANWGGDTWNAAMSSAMGAFRVIGAIAIWLLAYSPIWGVFLIGGLWALRIWKRSVHRPQPV